MTPTNKDLTTTEDRLILSKPPPPSLILCRLFAPARYPTILVKPTKDQFDPNQEYEKCRRCPDHIECSRYIEAELWSKGIRITRHIYGKEEKKHYRRLHDARDK